MMVKTKKGWQIRSKKDGHMYPKIYKNKKAAHAQVKRHEMFKNMEK